jgi:hypothetical protein
MMGSLKAMMRYRAQPSRSGGQVALEAKFLTERIDRYFHHVVDSCGDRHLMKGAIPAETSA